MSWVLGVDVGGTFTDFSIRDDRTGNVFIHKRPSTPEDPSRAIIEGFQELLEKVSLDGVAVSRFAHGTTVATNALLQRKGGRLALVTTSGFRDLLEIGRQVRPKVYDLQIDSPPPLIPRHQRFEINERIGSKGEVITSLKDEDIDKVIEEIRALDDIDGVAVCLLFSFLNPAHEQRIGEAIKAALPDMAISLSSEVHPEFREYERFSTAVINAYLQPEVSRYMENLKQGIVRDAPAAKLGIFQSSGGLTSVERASQFPVRMALSGPAAGVVGAAQCAVKADIGDVITLDMGGTSTDVCVIRDGKADLANMRDISGFRIRLPMVDINTVGAGGGSIAHIGRDGLMKVGPISAGAVPGPACYGHGGIEPTVSDANLVLGRLPEQLVGGGLVLDQAKAVAAISPLADHLGMSIQATALGIIGIVNSNMTRAIRAVTVERGHDPRHFALMPFGGAGGLHAIDVAESLMMKTILIPRSPGILCAEGLIVADLQESFVATKRTPLDGDLSPVKTVLAELIDKAMPWFEDEGASSDSLALMLQVDMRYIGQNYELSVPAGDMLASPELPDPEHLKSLFHEAHERSYGHHDKEAAVEIVNIRLQAVASLPEISSVKASVSSSSEPVEYREVWFDPEGPCRTPVFDRASLEPGFTHEGAAIFTQTDATTLMPPWCRMHVDKQENLILEITR
jgi:N-methylhydantoinase A